MILRVYAIYDKKSKLYNQVIFSQNAGCAMRSYTSLVFERSNMMSRFPADYDIYDIGEFDDNSGKLSGCDAPVFICSLESLAEIHPKVTEERTNDNA